MYPNWRIRGAIVTATGRSDRRRDDRRDSRLVCTLQAIVVATIAPTVAATIVPCIRPIGWRPRLDADGNLFEVYLSSIVSKDCVQVRRTPTHRRSARLIPECDS